MYKAKILRAKKTSYSSGFPNQSYSQYKRFTCFHPVSETKIKVSTTSLSDDHQVCFIHEEYKRLDVKQKDYVTCVYDSQWLLGQMKTFQLIKVNTLCFSILQAPKHLFKHTENHILSVVSPIELSLATTGRCHNINRKLSEELSLFLSKHLR
ncbi:hypothetical protein PR048_024222, partial [Dryococelus australis]